MPRGNRNGRSERRREYSGRQSDDESINDNASVISNISEGKSAEDGEETDFLAQEQLEEKLLELIDGLTQKSSQGRTNCFQSLTKAFIKKSMPAFIRERYFTICDGIERSLKKGGGPEKTAAAELATIMTVQLGGEDASEEIYKLLKSVLLTTICDNSAAPAVRAMCCTALGQITFLAMADVMDALVIMHQLELIYSASYLKGDGSMPNVTAETGTLHAAAISAWSLLFTLLSPGNIEKMINNSKTLPSLEKLSELLKSLHLDVRMAAGEALAIIFELGREESENFEEDFAVDVLATLKQLATDSHKYRAKKDRKLQKASFRDILKFIESDTVPELQVRFEREMVLIGSWAKRKQYESLCNILGPSINLHLAENEFLRDIFEIIDEPVSNDLVTHFNFQMNRRTKRMVNTANSKARTLSRAKNRDKRAIF
ncbi:interferon-related developmental regulator 1 [Leptinotarsa decemlineata]|uniref:interferon-related developmental regulator 1 n=1 Tax=Leptinotarsa decemlineata TaxID=7539 RepID=UPI003D3055A2